MFFMTQAIIGPSWNPANQNSWRGVKWPFNAVGSRRIFQERAGFLDESSDALRLRGATDETAGKVARDVRPLEAVDAREG